MIGGLYRPAATPIHVLPAEAKLLFLLVLGTAIILVEDLRILAAFFVASLSLYGVAGFGPLTLWRQLRPAIVLLAALALFLWISAGAEAALVATLRFSVLILLGALVTLTTSPAAMVDALERGLAPLRRFGLPVAQIALAITLAMRFVPVIAEAAREVRDAQAARGGGRNLLPAAVPTLVRTLKLADELGETLDARGFGLSDD